MGQFALLILTNLKILYFDTKDELYDAVHQLKSRGIEFVPLIYNHSSKTYTVPEVLK
jgi:hypothetical protein